MTGAGAATAAYTVENSYGDGPAADPTWTQPGLNVSLTDLSIEQALQRARNPDDPTPAGSREGEWEGAVGVGFDLTDDNFHELVFADAGTALPNSFMSVPSATWYFGVDLPDGSTDARTPVGAVVIDATIEYNRGENIRVELTMLHGGEQDDIAAPSTVQKPSVDDIYTYHGTGLTVDGNAQALLQSASLSLSNLASLRRGQDRKPYDAVTGAIEPSLSTDAIYTEADQNTLSYGSTSGGNIEIVGAVDGSLSFENGKGDSIEYSMSGVQPNTYNWADLITADTHLTEPIDYHVADVEVV